MWKFVIVTERKWNSWHGFNSTPTYWPMTALEFFYGQTKAWRFKKQFDHNSRRPNIWGSFFQIFNHCQEKLQSRKGQLQLQVYESFLLIDVKYSQIWILYSRLNVRVCLLILSFFLEATCLLKGVFLITFLHFFHSIFFLLFSFSYV